MWSIIIFGLSAGILFDVLIGLLGSRRNIGFGWAFLASVFLTPFVGLIITLLSDQLPAGAEPKYGCLGYSFGCLGTILIILFTILAILGVLSLLIPIA